MSAMGSKTVTAYKNPPESLFNKEGLRGIRFCCSIYPWCSVKMVEHDKSVEGQEVGSPGCTLYHYFAVS